MELEWILLYSGAIHATTEAQIALFPIGAENTHAFYVAIWLHMARGSR